MREQAARKSHSTLFHHMMYGIFYARYSLTRTAIRKGMNRVNSFFCTNESRYIAFTIRKINSVTGAGIPGVVFELTCNNSFASRGTTDSNGLLTLYVYPCINYMLREVVPAPGYVPIDHVYHICVDACGCIYADGVPVSQLIIRNTPVLASFTAIKVNVENGMPLSGAVYTLSMGASAIASTISNAEGQVSFSDLSPGTYELVETTPPPGFQENTEVLSVVVAQDGSVTIMGQPANGFILNNTPIMISASPIINSISEGASIITGTGVPGSNIVVTLPNGFTLTTIVEANGTWRVDVPSEVELLVGEVVSATQTEQGKLPSVPALSTVVALVEPFLDKMIDNMTSPGEPVEPGDLLLITILAGNLGGEGSVWSNVVLTDFILDDLTFVPGTVAIDGQFIPVGTGAGQYSYNSETRALIIHVGDLDSGVMRAVTFEVTVNADASGDEIVNNVTAMSISAEPVMTATTSVSIDAG